MTSISPKRKFSKPLSPVKSAKKPAPPQGQRIDGVFLGGACNPTTWRKDIAIPFLEENRIPYFNPQVEEWRPELIAQETAAKELASVLLFVFQPHLTRGLASLVEVAHLAAPPPTSGLHRHARRPRSLIIVRPSPRRLDDDSDSLQSHRKSSTVAEAENIDAAYQWLEGLRFSHVRFFEELEDALVFIKSLYTKLKLAKSQQQSNLHSTKRKLRRMPKIDYELNYFDDSKTVTREELQAAYRYSSCCDTISPDLKLDLYCGGASCKSLQTTTTSELDESTNANTSWAISRQDLQRDFALSMAVQQKCPRLYFHISRQGLWLVEQMEAAFAIGCGKEVILCIEYLSDEETAPREARSVHSSGYSSLASTPDGTFKPPANAVLGLPSSTASAGSRSGSSSECEEAKTTSLKLDEKRVFVAEKEAVVKALSADELKGKSPTEIAISRDLEVDGLPPAAVKDHNRSRSYLKSLLETTVERGGKGILLSRPVECISDLLDLL